MIDNQNNIGQRIRAARKQKGINQTELANLLGNRDRTIQKYESGEIEVSIAMINELAKVLDTTSTFLIGYEHDEKNILSLSDIMDFLFQIGQSKGLEFQYWCETPSHYDEWSVLLHSMVKTSQQISMQICAYFWKNLQSTEGKILRITVSVQNGIRNYRTKTLLIILLLCWKKSPKINFQQMFLENRILIERVIVWQKHYKEQWNRKRLQKLSGKRRNPWRAVVTNGWAYNDEKGKLVQNRVTIGYYHTRDEADTSHCKL